MHGREAAFGESGAASRNTMPKWAVKFAVGFGVAFLLLSGVMSKPLWPQFAGIVFSNRDVMAIWFAVGGSLAVGALAWRISPAILWLVVAYVWSGLNVGFQGQSMANLQALLWGVVLLTFLTGMWQEHKAVILWGLTLAILVNVAVSIPQFFVEDLGLPAPAGLVWRDPFFMTARAVHEVEGLTSHYSLYAALLALSMPFLYLRLGWPVWIVTPLIILGLKHRSSMFAAGLAAFLMIPGRRKWHAAWIGAALTIIVVGIRGSFSDYVGPSLDSWTGMRMSVWVVTLAKALQKPFLGWSPGAFSLWHPTFMYPAGKAGLTFVQAHNEFLQLLFETGFVGFLSVPFYLWHTGRRLRRARPWTPELRAAFASLVPFLFIAFTSFPLRIGVMSVAVIVVLAALHGELLGVEDARAKADAWIAQVKLEAPHEDRGHAVPRRRTRRLATAGDLGAGDGDVQAAMPGGDRVSPRPRS